MIGGLAGMFAAMPQGYLSAQQQMQKMQDDEAQRQLRQQQFETTNRQAPLQDQLLRAQAQHMARPDINQQRYADERAATIQAGQLSPYASMPGATPMPQPPQGGTPPAFQNAQPMQGVSPGMPSQGGVPNPFAQGQPQTASQPPQGQSPQMAGVPGMPPQVGNQPQGMYQQPAPAAMQPQGQQPQQMPNADPVVQFEQQAMGQLQQHVQSLPPARSQQEQYQRALAVQQAQQQIQQRAQQMRAAATAQLQSRKQEETEKWRERQEAHWGQVQEGQGARAERSSLTSQRDTDMRNLGQALSGGMISQEVYDAGTKAIDKKYGAIAPGAKGTDKAAVTPELTGKLEAAMRAKYGDTIPSSAIGETIDVGGKQYKIVNNDGEVGYEPTK